MAGPMLTLDELLQSHHEDHDQSRQSLEILLTQPIRLEDEAKIARLVNHIVGEESRDWQAAYRMIRTAVPEPTQTPVIRQAAIAATMAGDVVRAWQLEGKLAAAYGVPIEQAAVATRMGALQFLMSHADQVAVCEVFTQTLARIEAWPVSGPLTETLAATCNNATSALLDREDLMTTDPTVAEALTRGAEVSRGLWRKAGTWMQSACADYLVALVRKRGGDWAAARAAAQDGLDTITANGPEDVDRAFLFLEIARASAGAGDLIGRDAALIDANALAAEFKEDGLKSWFASRAKGLG
ncbi:hypothetical protein BH10PSE17_BH10PSE17_12560 [soil metagenome]